MELPTPELYRLHDIDYRIDWCRCCGQPMEVLVNNPTLFCDGQQQVVHSCYFDALRRHRAFMKSVFGTIALTGRLPDSPT